MATKGTERTADAGKVIIALPRVVTAVDYHDLYAAATMLGRLAGTPVCLREIALPAPGIYGAVLFHGTEPSETEVQTLTETAIRL